MIKIRDYGMYIALAIIMIIFTLLSNNLFMTPRVISDLIDMTGYIAVLSVGMTLVIVIRHIDLSVGYIAGFLGALAAILTSQFNKLSFIAKIVLTALVSIALFLIGTLLFPRAYVQLAVDNIPPDYPDAGAFSLVGGVLLGFGVGYLIEQEYVRYDPSELTNKKKIINLIVGLAIIFIVFLPFEYLIEIDSAFYRFFRYGLTAFVVAYVIPLICTKIDSKSKINK